MPNELLTLPIIGPGLRGLNTELAESAGFADQTWAALLQNVVFDDLSRIHLRKGYVDQTTTPITGTPAVERIFEWQRLDETTSLIAVADDFTVQVSADNGQTWSDISGDMTTNGVSTSKIQFATLNDVLYAAVPGHKVYRYDVDTYATFTEITTAPISRGIILSAFGRLWLPQDGTDVIKYSALLDGGDWTGTAAGSIDASNAWTGDADTINAMAAFGASLLVFGAKHILIYVDGAGSELGVDPDNLYVVDTIEGTGTIHKDAIVNVGEGDLWFLGPQGVQSLARVIQDKVNPLVDISKNVRSLVLADIEQNVGSSTTVQAVFSPENQFVLYNFPERGRIVCFDTRQQLEDGTYRVTTWEDLPYQSVERRLNGDILFGLTAGNVARYEGYRDNGSTIYKLKYASPWLDFGEQHGTLKILKSFYAFVYGRETLDGTVQWSFDFNPLSYSQTYSNDYSPEGAEWGSGEWGLGEFGDDLRMRKQHIAGRGQGQFIKVYWDLQSTDVDAKVALQEIGLRVKMGRVA